jgi:hypothetical protein
MRTSLISRSVIAVASVAIGSFALSAVPANAAAPNGITQEQILTAAAGVRANPAASPGNIFSPGPGYGPAANRALRAMANRVCITDPDGPEVNVQSVAAAPATAQSADGVVVSAFILSSEGTSGSMTGRLCTFGALAPVAARSVLTGTATVAGGPTVSLSGDAFLTPPVNTPFTSSTTQLPSFSASGAAVQSNAVKVTDKKTKKEKKVAKAKYDKRLKAAKKSYKKALDKAGSSKSKKAAAKKAWSAKKKSAKAKYKYAIAGYKLVTRKTATPFSVSAQVAQTP